MKLIISPNLDTRDLRLVLAIATTGTTAAAAEVLNITQSAVSRALGVAEDHARTPLFERTSRGLTPTAAGALVIAHAPEILESISALQRRLSTPAELPRKVRFAAECAMAYPWLAKVALHLKKTAPGLTLRMPMHFGDELPDALGRGDLDAALLTSRPPQGVQSEAMFADELIFLVAEDHPLAARANLSRRDLLDHTLLVSTARAGDQWFVRHVFGSQRVKLRVERFAITEAIVEFARAGMGIAILSEWIAAPYLGARCGLRLVRLGSGPLIRRWRLCYRPTMTTALSALSDAIVASRPMPLHR